VVAKGMNSCLGVIAADDCKNTLVSKSGRVSLVCFNPRDGSYSDVPASSDACS
jgi:hypothetical protein